MIKLRLLQDFTTCLCFFRMLPCKSHKATHQPQKDFFPLLRLSDAPGRLKPFDSHYTASEMLLQPPSPVPSPPEEEQPSSRVAALPVPAAAPLTPLSEAPGENTRAENPTVRHSALILIVKNSLMRADWYYIAALIKEGYGTAF